MNRLAQALIVLVLLLSIVFAATQVVLFSKREALARRFKDTDSALGARTTELATARSELNDIRVRLDGARNTLETARVTLGEKFAAAKERADEAKQQLDNLTAAVEQSTNTLNALRQDIAARDEMIETLRVSVTERQDEIRTHLDKIDGLNDNVGNRDTSIEELQFALDETKKELVALGEVEEQWRLQIQELLRRNIRMPDQPQPAIDGIVVSVDLENGFVVVDQGKDAGVQPNTTFTLYDEAQGYVATLVIHEVEPRVSAGRVIRKGEGKAIKQGLRATTQIP